MNTKQKLAALVAISLGSIGALPAYSASTTHNLNVQATINGNCRFNVAGPTNLLVGTPLAGAGIIDQSEQPSAATGTANVLYRCTTGTVASTAADLGTHASGLTRQVCIGATASCMPYSLSLVGGAQTGLGHGAAGDLTLAVSATIASADYVLAPAGVYNDTVVLTITP
jgi:hypothetical protein